MALLVRRFEKERKRHLEYVGNFHRVGLEIEWRFDPADHRCDAIARHGLVVGEPTKQCDALAWQADFLLGFAQCRGANIAGLRFDTAPGRERTPEGPARSAGRTWSRRDR